MEIFAIKDIKYCAITISTLYLLGMPLYYLMAERVDPPGIIPIGLVIIFAACFIKKHLVN
ncbi:DUF2975 domain-containing protein [Paenibacillus popilliae]|uniref:DUF2975 domain-containing protein n=1 Tax=Paenibacillus popilliae TaxID=78057 RepID=UPI0011D20EF9